MEISIQAHFRHLTSSEQLIPRSISLNMPFSKIRNILICDGVDPVCGNLLRENGMNVTCQAKLTLENLLKEIEKYDALIVRSATKVTEEVINAAKNLKIIGRAGTGVDNIDCAAATRHGVIVMNAPGGNTLSAAEHTCAMICSMSRKIPQACGSMKDGLWNRKAFMGSELNGKTLAILGLGRIGREVAFRMQAFGMRTIGYDPMVSPKSSLEFGVESMSLENIWPQADYISVHTPLIPQTKNLLNDDVFAKCRDGVCIVNCARGGIIDEDALLRALQSGKCGGVALDVFVQEPPTNEKLINHPNTVCTPHLGASTIEAQKRVAEEIAVQILDLVKNKGFNGLVNAPMLNQVMLTENKPLFELCDCMGALAATIVCQNNQDSKFNLEIETYGELSLKKPTFFSTSVLHGLLKKRSQADINVISAPAVAQETGCQVTVKQNNDSFPHQYLSETLDGVVVKLSCGPTKLELSGFVMGQFPVLYSINDHCFNNPGFVMRGQVVIFKSVDYMQYMLSLSGELKSKNINVTSICPSTYVNGKAWCAMCTSDYPVIGQNNNSCDFHDVIKF